MGSEHVNGLVLDTFVVVYFDTNELRTLAMYCTMKMRMILKRASLSDSYLFILLIWPSETL